MKYIVRQDKKEVEYYEIEAASRDEANDIAVSGKVEPYKGEVNESFEVISPREN